MGRDNVRLAIERAGFALVGWRDGATALHWLGLLSAWSAIVRENSKDISVIMTMDFGKPLLKGRGVVMYGTCFLNYYAAEAVRVNSAGGGTICPPPLPTSGPARPRAGSGQ
jgi:succinate-semialdehyde dehydrogenase/glutarate-semialdehyde dehydrogenase